MELFNCPSAEYPTDVFNNFHGASLPLKETTAPGQIICCDVPSSVLFSRLNGCNPRSYNCLKTSFCCFLSGFSDGLMNSYSMLLFEYALNSSSISRVSFLRRLNPAGNSPSR